MFMCFLNARSFFNLFICWFKIASVSRIWASRASNSILGWNTLLNNGLRHTRHSLWKFKKPHSNVEYAALGERVAKTRQLTQTQWSKILNGRESSELSGAQVPAPADPCPGGRDRRVDEECLEPEVKKCVFEESTQGWNCIREELWKLWRMVFSEYTKNGFG